MITDGERYNQVINTWTLVTTEVEEETFQGLEKDRDGFNPIFMMADSGIARYQGADPPAGRNARPYG